jgi:hypothetical protein
VHPLLEKLCGGDRRSIGRSEEVVSQVLKQPILVALLIEGADADDALIRMRASDAMEKVSRVRPEYLHPHKKRLIDTNAPCANQSAPCEAGRIRRPM